MLLMFASQLSHPGANDYHVATNMQLLRLLGPFCSALHVLHHKLQLSMQKSVLAGGTTLQHCALAAPGAALSPRLKNTKCCDCSAEVRTLLPADMTSQLRSVQNSASVPYSTLMAL
jgi:hypothetical protein